MSSKAVCPSCGELVTVGARPKIGQIVRCKDCDTELEVVELDPVELDWAYDEENEDFEEDELEDDDEMER